MNDLHNDLQFFSERMEIEKIEKLAATLHNKIGYVIHTKTLKHALNHKLVLKNVHRCIKFNQEAWLKPYIDINKELGSKRSVLENLRRMWENIEILTGGW